MLSNRLYQDRAEAIPKVLQYYEPNPIYFCLDTRNE